MVQASKLLDEVARVPAGVADTVTGLADRVDLRQVADQMVDKVSSSRDQIQRKTSPKIAGSAALMGLLVVLFVVILRMRGRHDDWDDRKS
jgi:hypothetical protein